MATSLAASEICAIIKVCGASGVSSLKWGGLEVQFGALPGNAPSPLATENRPDPSPPLTEMSGELTENQKLAADLEHEKAVLIARELQLANMMLEDPVGFEQLMGNGELADESDDQEA